MMLHDVIRIVVQGSIIAIQPRDAGHPITRVLIIEIVIVTEKSRVLLPSHVFRILSNR